MGASSAKSFEPVTASDSRPVHGSLPSPVGHMINNLLEKALEPKQFVQLAFACVTFTENLMTWYDHNRENLRGYKHTEYNFDFKKTVSQAQSLCKAVTMTNETRLKSVLDLMPHQYSNVGLV